MIKKYRKKPVIIEAVKWNGSMKEIIDFVGEDLPTYGGEEQALRIDTLEGPMKVSLGDYIIKEPFPNGNRKFYPCKPDIFYNTYEEIKDV